MSINRVFWSALILAFWFSLAPALGSLIEGPNGGPIYPLGFYELPKEDAALQRMANAGVNLVRVHSKEDLDRAQSVGMRGVFPLSLQEGATDKIRQTIQEVKDHPALAVWEGPDEIIWTFTTYSGLHRVSKVYPHRDEWWRQTDIALDYSNEKAGEIIPKLLEGIAVIRDLDNRDRPVWINEAVESDARMVRRYMDDIDITGCDIYPVSDRNRRLTRVTEGVERWKKIGRGKPVWMVLQAFSWDELGEYHGGGRERTYPTFEESRFMAYTSIVHGAAGILYWGSNYLQTDEVRESIYALTTELSALQPFLVSEEKPEVTLDFLEIPQTTEGFGVQCFVRKAGEDWLIVLVNEDEVKHMGVEISGLDELEGKTLHQLYGKDDLMVEGGEIIARLRPFEVKVYSTSPEYESDRTEGRDFGWDEAKEGKIDSQE
ncbi:MAG: hypothetical protein KC978_14535 [Candidatus Omnitrophica bacterium]|nr:hypothetical protein [Candidatus Omnitrophota bacterium]